MIIKASEKGQVLILITLVAIALFAFAALAIDGSMAFSDKRQAQNAADSSVLAAALAKIRGRDYTAAAVARAASNGYSNNGVVNVPAANTSIVQVNLCNETGIDCEGLPASANEAEYIRVRIVSYRPTTFARVIGRDVIASAAEAVAHVKLPTSAAAGSFFKGAGMVATRDDNSNQCFLLNGNADLGLHNTGMFVNCTGAEALFINGGADLSMDADADIAGCAKDQGGHLSGEGEIDCHEPKQTIDASTFENIPRALPTPTCTKPGVPSGNTLSPGYYNGNVSVNSTVTLTEGTYCFNGGLNINGQANLQGTGAIKMVLSGDLNLNGSANTFDDLEIYTQNARLSVKGSLTSPRLRFFATESGGLDIQNGTLTSGDAYFYSRRGMIQWNSSSKLHLHAPLQGDKFGGLLIYQPWENTNAFILNGNTGSVLTGTILVPKSDVTYNGGAEFELHGQVIGYTFKVNGGGHSDIYYKASENYQPPGPAEATIQLTK